MAGYESFIEQNPKLILLWQTAYNLATQTTNCLLDNPGLIQAAHASGNVTILSEIKPGIERQIRSELARVLEGAVTQHETLTKSLKEAVCKEDVEAVRRIAEQELQTGGTVCAPELLAMRMQAPRARLTPAPDLHTAVAEEAARVRLDYEQLQARKHSLLTAIDDLLSSNQTS